MQIYDMMTRGNYALKRVLSRSRQKQIERSTKTNKIRDLLARKNEKGSGKKGREGQMRKEVVESLIYAPDKKMQNSIRPPKSASSIFVVHNVAQRPRY